MGRPFNKVLIANRGEIAARILACLDRLGIDSVAIYHPLDAKSPAVAGATEAVEITGETPAAAYLDIDRILSICRALNVDAVHPGYGFLAENPAFAEALTGAGITFIGPGPEVMKLMGDKIASRNFVKGLGLPVPPAVTLDPDDPGMPARAAGLGFPLVIKASAGGGGKGMNIVHSGEQLAATLRLAASEAGAYFGDARVYAERYFERTRHIEVQVLGDGEQCIHLGERECSVQRRFQKLIEEAPSPALSPETRAAICDTAVRIARAAGYESAGTVEFLYTPDGDFYFLEMNTRIQVEHPVTELVHGVDLVAQQINVAAGGGLSPAPDNPGPRGHAIECRICAEDAFNDYLPETGRLLFAHIPDGVRFDSGLFRNQVIGPAFDPMLAKLIVHGESRADAIRKMSDALGELALLGIGTNREFLKLVVDSDAFRAGRVHTGLLDELRLGAPPLGAAELTAALAAGYLADRHNRQRMDATPAPYLTLGEWSN